MESGRAHGWEDREWEPDDDGIGRDDLDGPQRQAWALLIDVVCEFVNNLCVVLVGRKYIVSCILLEGVGEIYARLLSSQGLLKTLSNNLIFRPPPFGRHGFDEAPCPCIQCDDPINIVWKSNYTAFENQIRLYGSQFMN